MKFDTSVLYPLEYYIGEMFLIPMTNIIEIKLNGLDLYFLFDHILKGHTTDNAFWLRRFPICIIYDISNYFKYKHKRTSHRNTIIYKALIKIMIFCKDVSNLKHTFFFRTDGTGNIYTPNDVIDLLDDF